MKKYFIFILLLSHINSRAADINPTFSSLQELKRVIALQFAQGGKTFDEVIGNIIKFMVADKNLYTFLNDPTKIKLILEPLSQKLNVPQSVIAAIIGTPGAVQWLQNTYKTDMYVHVLNDALNDTLNDSLAYIKPVINQDFFRSGAFIKLVSKLKKEEFLIVFSSFLKNLTKIDDHEGVPDDELRFLLFSTLTGRRISLITLFFLLAAGSDFLTDEELKNVLKQSSIKLERDSGGRIFISLGGVKLSPIINEPFEKKIETLFRRMSDIK